MFLIDFCGIIINVAKIISEMKVSIILSVIILVILGLVGFFIFPRYGSAFEADQACHSELSINYESKIIFGCDHDLETRQWILFETQLGKEPAKVIRRFRY